MSTHHGFRFSCIALCLAAHGSLSCAGVVIRTEPIAVSPLPIRAENSGAPIAAAKTPGSAQAEWTVSLPSSITKMCFAGVCLGDSLDRLPVVGVNGRSEKTPGHWHVAHGPSLTGAEFENAERFEQDRLLVDVMKKKQSTCSSPSSEGLKQKMRLVFTPENGSEEGLEIVAEFLPKKEMHASSAYAVTQIRMAMRQAPAELALEWADQVAEMWPGLSPIIAEGTKRMPDTYLQWTASTPVPKGVSDAKKSSVLYTVAPSLAVDDEEFNARRWAHGVVNHELIWSHGIGKSLPAMLSRQQGCSAQAVE